ncbi:flippase [Kosakonia cowanii]|jgi:O-antigen/teichoic acid export membrane protein|uniref:flippase n=1 Tax=Kosakonia cowanii TaxID=208223 RepID=UPI001124055C|nr:flippase [Kosakonia cowanii]MDP9767233.1 O-antigen/teichoic acid export membrane protein [Atlantibacter hermannii]TPD67824.1 flippase [Kosakonia cowanii]TPD91054.1 flippase [Kosakonia cowanii]TPE07332.1 flippase [Kosakonia cowanii]
MLIKNALIRNSTFNLAGYVIPTLIAIPALGFIARALGPELFGIYTLAMALVGYASIFDFGLTRAIIREIALYKDDQHEKNRIISTSTLFLAGISVFLSLLIYFKIDTVIAFINVSDSYKVDAKHALEILLFAIPLFILNQLWVSILEGEEKFGVLNIQKTISNTFIVGLPAVLVYYNVSLVSAVSGLIAGRFISFVISFLVLRKDIVAAGLAFHPKVFKRLVYFGGWMTVSNIISPMMVYFDRFIISYILGAKNVGYYTAPAEIISRMSIVPTSISRAVFPRLSGLSDIAKFKKELKFSYLIMALICIPLVAFCLIFSGKIMYYWLGPQYFIKSSEIFFILLTGFLFNSLAQIPFSAIQSLGKSKITALLHCAEVIPYFLVLYALTSHYGLIGTAYAWSIRVIIDFFALFFISAMLNKRH